MGESSFVDPIGVVTEEEEGEEDASDDGDANVDVICFPNNVGVSRFGWSGSGAPDRRLLVSGRDRRRGELEETTLPTIEIGAPLSSKWSDIEGRGGRRGKGLPTN